MSRPRLSQVAAVLAIGGAAAAGITGLSEGASSAPHRSHALRFVIGKPSERHEFFHKGGVAGDRIVERDGLYEGGKRRGVLLSVFTLTGKDGSGVGQDVVIVGHDRIFMDGAQLNDFEDGNEPEAVVGGTGRFRLARGTGVVDFTGTRNVVRLTLRQAG